MTNPRKFSEKIALHNQKQAEGTAEFEKVLQEVFGAIKSTPQPRLNVSQNESIDQLNSGADLNQATSNHISLQQSHQMLVNAQNQQQYNENGQILINQQALNHLSPNILTTNCRAESLPALTANEKSRSSIDLRSALSNLSEMTQGDLKKSTSRNRMPSPNHQLKTNSVRHQQMSRQTQANQYQQYNGSYNELNSNNIPIQTTRSQVNLHHYTSQQTNNDQHFVHKANHNSHHNRVNPYLLCAPEPSNWRRTNSDSALNQSTAIYCEQQSNSQQQHLYNQQQQFYDIQQQRQKVINQQPHQQQTDLNKIAHETDITDNESWDTMDSAKQIQQSTQTNLQNVNGQQSQANNSQGNIMYQNNRLNKTDFSNATSITSAPVISINYQNQNTYSSSMNNMNNSTTAMYTQSIMNQNVQCSQTNYQSNNSSAYEHITQQQQQQQTNGKRPKSCDVENNTSNQFNRTLVSTNTNRGAGQLPTLQFQSSSQNNINQLSEQSTFSNLNSNHSDHQSNHHHSSNAIHVNNVSNNNSSTNFLYANSNTCSGSLPDLSLFNNPPAPLVVSLDQEDALSSGLNSNDNSNNSNQSSGSYQFGANQFGSVASASVANKNSIPMNYRANNYVQYNCSNQNSSNSNSPLHQNAFTNMSSQQMPNIGPNGNINFSNKIQDSNKFINQLTNNQLATQFHNHHISSPVRPSSNESAEDVVIFNQLTGNDMLISNEYETDENIEQFDFDLFSNSQDNQNDKLITNDLDKIDSDQDPNNNTNSDLVNSFYQDQLMNHRNVSTPSETTAPNSPASSIHNLNSPVSSPTAVNTNCSLHLNNNLANMTLNNDLSQNGTLPNKNEFLVNGTNCMIGDQQVNSKDIESIDNDYLQLDFAFEQQNQSTRDSEDIFSDHNLDDKDIIMVSIPNIIFTEHNGDLSSIDELYAEMST